jgi:hypothetical protein
MAKKLNPVESQYKDLIKVLTENHHFRPAELLGWMLEEALARFGSLKERTFKEDVQSTVDACLRCYTKTVEESEPFTDILGSVYMSLASAWGQRMLGQYFTPQSLARMMAAFTYEEPVDRGKSDLIRTCDPACGSGVMILSFLQQILESEGDEGLRRFSVTGIDIDVICARMCAVQLLVNCLVHDFAIGEIVVLRGDSLSQKPLREVVAHAAAKTVVIRDQALLKAA